MPGKSSESKPSISLAAMRSVGMCGLMCLVYMSSPPIALRSSDGNAAALHTTFESTLEAIEALDWKAIEATYWADNRHQKQAEFLVADFFPWSGFHEIGCHDVATAAAVTAIMMKQNHRPKVSVKKGWYY